MNKKEINPLDYAKEILQALPKGILLVTEAEDCVNAMIIGWGAIGIEWGKPIFTVYVRESRFTYELLEKNPVFTVCVPYGKDIDQKIVKICGAKSGRDTDKIAAAGLTLVDGEAISTSAVKQLPLTLECKIVWQEKQKVNNIASRFHNFYPKDEEGAWDAHVAYHGEILKAYILED